MHRHRKWSSTVLSRTVVSFWFRRRRGGCDYTTWFKRGECGSNSGSVLSACTNMSEDKRQLVYGRRSGTAAEINDRWTTQWFLWGLKPEPWQWRCLWSEIWWMSLEREEIFTAALIDFISLVRIHLFDAVDAASKRWISTVDKCSER